jgi:phosphoribosyl-ATP pyrophosphohydrolase
MTNIIELDSDYRELLSDFAQLVKVENNQILEKMRENASEVVDEFDDVLEA